MFNIRGMYRIMLALILALATYLVRGSSYNAGGYHGERHGCTPTYHYETVTVCAPRTVACTKLATLYDECGRPYQVVRTYDRTVQVPVTKRVLVRDR
jgi:hypothetical protein